VAYFKSLPLRVTRILDGTSRCLTQWWMEGEKLIGTSVQSTTQYHYVYIFLLYVLRFPFLPSFYLFIPCQFVVHYMNRMPRTCETTWIRSTRLSQLRYGQQLRIYKGLLRWLCAPDVSLEP
jgi:hypothetical protein